MYKTETTHILDAQLVILAAFFFLLFFPGNSFSSENGTETQVDASAQKSISPSSIPDIAEIVPLEIKFVSRLQELENQLEQGIAEDVLDDDYLKLEKGLSTIVDDLETLIASEQYKYNKLVDFRELLNHKRNTFKLISEPVSTEIRKLGILRAEWQEESNRWTQWQDALLIGGGFEPLKVTFDEATETIDTALDLILSELDTLLAIQERHGEFERKIETVHREVEQQIIEERRNTLFNDTPPMLSKEYLSQLSNIRIWKQVIDEFNEISLPEKEAVAQHGWIVIFQLAVIVFLSFFIRQRKTFFEQIERWQFLARYPVAAGVFLSYVICTLVYEYEGVPSSWKFLLTLVGTAAFVRLIKGVVEEDWKARCIYALVGTVLVTRFLDVLGVPIPVFRLYICLAALAGVFFCTILAKELKNANTTGPFLWLLYGGVGFFFVVVIIEILGRKALASYLFVSLLRSLGTVLIFALLMYIVHGGFEWLFNTPLLRRSTALNDSETGDIILKLTRFLDSLIVILIVVPAILMIWGVFQNLGEATQGVLNFGFKMGAHRITVGLFLISATIIYASFLISWLVQKLLIDEVLFQRRMEKGARISIARLVHYFIVVVGFLVAISALGIELSKLTIMLSALGVGIGFGLQGIVNNFVSGLVLLFEQPVRVGDLIEIDGIWAEIKGIGIRSTIVRTFDHADLIIPNADLISNKVINWTLGDRQARLIIQVGVAYGSDVELVMATLLECAEENKQITASPSPQALFLNFGDSALDFELRAFVPASMRIQVRSELNKQIDKRFRENGIEIAFPQLDIHLPELGKQDEKTIDPEEAMTAILEK
jgi:small-conductance mechanosensitive channel